MGEKVPKLGRSVQICPEINEQQPTPSAVVVVAVSAWLCPYLK
jgi:hypothetical protein